MTHHIVITGTDTGVGKTVFSAALTAALRGYYWKPVQSGLEEETDTEAVARLCNLSSRHFLDEAYRLRIPASPHYSAMQDGVEIVAEGLRPSSEISPLIIEGAGGLMVPLSKNLLFVDLFAKWQIPVVICARTTLGTINHTLLSIEALRQRDVPICGVAFIGNENTETQNIIAEIGKIRILGRMPFLSKLTKENLLDAFHDNFDIMTFLEPNS